jgi:isoleucyl-tRNA synthetase
MDRVRQVASAALSLRKANKLRVRLPLASLLVASEDAETLRPFADILRDEVNVKAVELTTDVAAHGGFEVAVNARAAGPRLGKDVQTVIKAVKAGDWKFAGGVVVAAGITLADGEFERRLVAKGGGAASELPGGSGLVQLDTDVTPELAAEGLVRDLIRVVQQARRDAGLDVADRIALTIDAPDEVVEAAKAHEEFLASETLATSVTYAPLADGSAGTVGDGTKVTVSVTKA